MGSEEGKEEAKRRHNSQRQSEIFWGVRFGCTPGGEVLIYSYKDGCTDSHDGIQQTADQRSAAAESPREIVRMIGGQSREVGSRKSHRDGVDERRDGVASARAGWKGEVLVEQRFLRTSEVKVAEGNGQRLRWIAGEDFGGEAADCDISAVDDVKEGGVGEGEPRERET